MVVDPGPTSLDKSTESFYLNLAKDFNKRLNATSLNETYNQLVA